MRSTRNITVGLIALCGVLLVLMLGLWLFSGRSINIPERDPDVAALTENQRSIEGAFDLAELEQYRVVLDRPLFRSDRKPAPEPVEASDELVEEEATAEPSPIDVVVRGIIVTPDVKVAMIRDNAAGKDVRLREGDALEGESAAWTLASIEPRKLVFEGGAPQPAEVELKVHTQGLKAPAAPRPPAVQSQPVEADQEATENDEEAKARAESRAEEIRRRVAERRAQLRAEAAQRRAKQQEELESDDYD